MCRHSLFRVSKYILQSVLFKPGMVLGGVACSCLQGGFYWFVTTLWIGQLLIVN